MKFAISGIALLLIIQLKATRLLQQATCATVDCKIGNNCYDLASGPVCCDPNICEAGSCGGNGLSQCDPDYECVITSCPVGKTDCPGVCMNANAIPYTGDACSECLQPKCPCGLCADGITTFGCCGGCQYRDNGNGQLVCSAVITNQNVCLPAIAIVGEKCGTQGIDCKASDAPSFTCSDGICYGNCGSCVYKQDINGNLNCEPELVAKEDICPCAGLENCDSYTPDGCNLCACPKDGSISLCTLSACPIELQTEPECRICSERYTLTGLTKQCIPRLTCANALCEVGTICYETSTGPVCCDPNICEAGICGGIDGIQCLDGYECVNNPIHLCDPNTPNDCAKVCVHMNGIPKVGCAIDHCNSYFDGCNDCTCNADVIACTAKVCKTLLEAHCVGCEAGYILNPTTNKCVACVCPLVVDAVCCDGITYSNICVAECQQATGQCTIGECGSSILKRNCFSNNDCDTSNGFRCKNDPICRGQSHSNSLCPTMVCFDRQGINCVYNEECDAIHGFVCVAINNQGVGVCGRYQ